VKLTWINLYSLPDETPSLVDWDGLSVSASPRLTTVSETATFFFSPVHGYQSFFLMIVSNFFLLLQASVWSVFPNYLCLYDVLWLLVKRLWSLENE
jgi:hypothetical protein